VSRLVFRLIMIWITPAISIGAALLALPASPILALPAVAQVLFAPGYALQLALFPGRVLGVWRRLAFSLGLSLIAAVIVGQLLNVTPWGLRAVPMAVSLGGVTVMAGAWGQLRERRVPAAAPAAGTGGFKLGIVGWLLLMVGAVLALDGVLIGVEGARRLPASDFTRFWMLPGEQNPQTVWVGIENLEAESRVYQVEIRVDGATAWEQSRIVLEPRQVWQTRLEIAAEAKRVEATLYQAEAPGVPYRQVWLARP
jgi:uncharacterized membrane protein